MSYPADDVPFRKKKRLESQDNRQQSDVIDLCTQPEPSDILVPDSQPDEIDPLRPPPQSPIDDDTEATQPVSPLPHGHDREELSPDLALPRVKRGRSVDNVSTQPLPESDTEPEMPSAPAVRNLRASEVRHRLSEYTLACKLCLSSVRAMAMYSLPMTAEDERTELVCKSCWEQAPASEQQLNVEWMNRLLTNPDSRAQMQRFAQSAAAYRSVRDLSNHGQRSLCNYD